MSKPSCFNLKQVTLKGSCHGKLTFYMLKSSFCWVQRHIFYPNPRQFSPPNQAKPKILELVVHWKVATRKNTLQWKLATRKNKLQWKVLPEEYVTPKTSYRKNTLHWKLATRKRNKNWKKSIFRFTNSSRQRLF